jgi:hypothetical protein
VELVCTLATVQRVVAEVARVQDVPSLASVKLIVAGVAGAAAAEDAAVDQVAALLPRESVVSVTALDRVLPGPAADDVIATVAPDLSFPARAAITSAVSRYDWRVTWRALPP